MEKITNTKMMTSAFAIYSISTTVQSVTTIKWREKYQYSNFSIFSFLATLTLSDGGILLLWCFFANKSPAKNATPLKLLENEFLPISHIMLKF